MPGPFHLSGPPDAGLVELVEYRREWPARFATERERLAGVLGPLAQSIAHIGSTAVPGLAAKPIVDIAILVEDLAAVDARADDLATVGYTLRVNEAGHRMFRTAPHAVHAHFWQDQPEFERHLLFRDRLRASPQDRALYERVKRELAARSWTTRDEYVQAKSEAIAGILARASVR